MFTTVNKCKKNVPYSCFTVMQDTYVNWAAVTGSFSTQPADGVLMLYRFCSIAAHSFPHWLVLSYHTVKALVIATCGCLNYHDPVNGRDIGTVMSRMGRLHLTQLLQTVLRLGLTVKVLKWLQQMTRRAGETLGRTDAAETEDKNTLFKNT